jgi:hypothetical protein
MKEEGRMITFVDAVEEFRIDFNEEFLQDAATSLMLLLDVS